MALQRYILIGEMVGKSYCTLYLLFSFLFVLLYAYNCLYVCLGVFVVSGILALCKDKSRKWYSKNCRLPKRCVCKMESLYMEEKGLDLLLDVS